VQNVWFAANLAIFHILLARSSGSINGSFIPLATSSALKSCGHDRISMVAAKKKRPTY
jgi:hypothetical protein